MGRFGFEALGCSAVPCLGRVCELHHVLASSCLVEFQRQRRDGGTASVSGMNRPGFMPEMVHGFPFRHPRRSRPLRPRIAIGVETAADDPKRFAASVEFTGSILGGPGIHLGKKIAALRKLIEHLS